MPNYADLFPSMIYQCRKFYGIVEFVSEFLIAWVCQHRSDLKSTEMVVQCLKLLSLPNMFTE